MSYVLLEHRELGTNAPGLANVRRLRQSVDRSAHYIAAKAKPWITYSAIGPRRFRLKPIKQAEAELPSGFLVPCLFDFIYAANRTEPVIVLRPINDCDFAGTKAFFEIGNIKNSSEIPPGLAIFRLEKISSDWLVGFRFRYCPSQQRPWPAWRLVAAPQIILARLVDGVLLSFAILHRETDGNGLLILGIGHIWGMRLAGFSLRLGTAYMLYASKLKQLSLRRGIDEMLCLDQGIATRLEPPDHDTCYAIAMRPCCQLALRVHDEHLSAELIRRDHLVEHCHSHARIVTEPAHPAVSRIEML